MEDETKRIILESIKKKNTIMPLFSVGYAYSYVVKWVEELEMAGLIEIDDNGVRQLTSSGEKVYKELIDKKVAINILPLQNVKIQQQDIDEVYLP